ncbi:hypothetical protein [Enterococcus faecium]|uniref:hypothetical protein n=1 Tax=Enterococcus faecium TaxID=1352 RepID=UPI0019D49457
MKFTWDRWKNSSVTDEKNCTTHNKEMSLKENRQTNSQSLLAKKVAIVPIF